MNVSLSNARAPRATILIPAYNEAQVIGRTLKHLTAGMNRGEFEVIVIANACHDDTVEKANKSVSWITVLQTDRPGKTNALRLGLGAATAPVNVFLDADLLVSADAIRRLIAPLESGAALASHGRMVVNLDGCSKSVCAFYRIWSLNPYLRSGKFGGLFAISSDGMRRLPVLPDVTADDEFISRQFRRSEKAFQTDVSFEASAPRTLLNLFQIRRRSLRGTREVEAMGYRSDRPKSMSSGNLILKHVTTQPSLWLASCVYFSMMVAVRLALAFEKPSDSRLWERDESSRAFAGE